MTRKKVPAGSAVKLTRETSQSEGPARIASASRPQLRDTLRWTLVASLLIALMMYIRFWSYVQTGGEAPVFRPNVADAFLPLGGLAGLKTWIATGYFDPTHPAAIVIVVAIVVTAWLFRRAPCSWLCPIGFVSEHLGNLGRRLFGRNVKISRWLDVGLLGVKYVGTFIFLWWLLSAPVGSLRAMMGTPYFAVADMKLFDVYSESGVGIIAIAGALLLVSIPVRSAWCRYLCPYGALQGMFGVLSPIVLMKRDSTCTRCRRCDSVCPNGVEISSSVGTVVSAECMGCTGCVSTCPRPGTLSMRIAGRKHLEPTAFGLAFVAAFLAIVTIAVMTGRFGSGLSPQDYRTMFQMSSEVNIPK